jgi:hypothetical protein
MADGPINGQAATESGVAALLANSHSESYGADISDSYTIRAKVSRHPSGRQPKPLPSPSRPA